MRDVVRSNANAALSTPSSFYPFVRFPMCVCLKTPSPPFLVRHTSSSMYLCQEKDSNFLIDLSLFGVAGANQKSSSHFHCLKCDYYCTDTNKVRMHKRAVHIH